MTLLCVCDTCCLVPLRRQQSTFVDAERWRDPQWRKRWWRCEDRRGRWWFGDTTDILARRSGDVRVDHDEVMTHLRERFAVLP